MSPTADPAIAAIEAHIESAGVDTSSSRWRTSLPAPPRGLSFDADRTYTWNIQTNKGKIGVRLRPDAAPDHVASTIYLTKLGFYDGLTFHRVIQGFMAQGGCPLGTGTGGPGYQYNGEFHPELKHDRPGMLSMANAGPGTDGSQFFLTFVPTDWLDGKHSIFGEVVAGEETLTALEAAGSRDGRTSEPLLMETCTVTVA